LKKHRTAKFIGINLVLEKKGKGMPHRFLTSSVQSMAGHHTKYDLHNRIVSICYNWYLRTLLASLVDHTTQQQQEVWLFLDQSALIICTLLGNLRDVA